MNVEEMVFISVDDHVVEPPDMFEGRVPAKYADRAPRIERNERGALIVPTTLEAMAYHQITAINLDGRAAWFCQCVESA